MSDPKPRFQGHDLFFYVKYLANGTDRGIFTMADW